MEEKIIVVEENVSKRLDSYLSEKLALTRSRVQKLINEGLVTISGELCKASDKDYANTEIKVIIPEVVKLEVVSENIPLDVLYEDEDLIVVNKAKGMVVHPAAGNFRGTLVNAIMAHCGDNLSQINGVIRPGIVHRIDKDTSGVLVVAKNNKAHLALAEQLKEHSMNRIYIAVASGVIKDESGLIDAPIGRNPKARKKMAVISGGRHAVTRFWVKKRLDDATIIELKLETGRTHQIRVHMAYIGHPLLGDEVYGNKKNKYGFTGQALHAKTLGFIHPTTNKYMEFTSELPDSWIKIMNAIK